MTHTPTARSDRPEAATERSSPSVIDLRSDTVTLPTPEMRAAMAAAPVGDDFYREDPTVDALEKLAAELLGKEAALFVPSGTMGNLLAYLTHAPAGGEVIGPEPAHSFLNEGGNPARIAGVMVRTFPQEQGELDLDRIRGMIRGRRILSPPTVLLWVEQPTRGYVVPLEQLAELRQLATTYGVPVHMDGARIFNAALALGVPAHVIAAYADSVMFCVSKGLGAPVGSLLVGSKTFVEEARHFRQMLGGGMRQAGIIAAGGLYALNHHIARLAEDHANARRLAAGLQQLPGLRLDRGVVETNIFYVDVAGGPQAAHEFVQRLRQDGVLVNPPARDRQTIRFVTHIGITEADIDRAIEAARRALA
jgi:threonine aldolase